MCRKHCLLLAEVFNDDCEDGTLRRGGIAKPPDVGFAERPLPRECLSGNEPRSIAVTLAFRDLRQFGGNSRGDLDTDHVGYGS